jgi:hypothetical protein
MAFRRFPFESSAILTATSGGKSNGTFLATYVKTAFIYDKDSVREGIKEMPDRNSHPFEFRGSNPHQ